MFLYVLCYISDAGIYDRVVIQELLKTVAQSHQLESTTQREFKGQFANKVMSVSYCFIIIIFGFTVRLFYMLACVGRFLENNN